MSSLPSDFVADLRRLKSWASMDGSLWREPFLVTLTYGRHWQLLRQLINGRQRLRILDVGCGSGYLSLELSRVGHDVVGIDPDDNAIGIAQKTKDTDPYASKRGNLSYYVMDLEGFSPGPEYDVVLLSRVLHHTAAPRDILRRAADCLREDGRLVCIEFAYDRFDRRAAAWLHESRELLSLAGCCKPSKEVSGPVNAIEDIVEEWFHEYEERGKLNPFADMVGACQDFFSVSHLTWHPYLYWDLLETLKVTSPDTGKALGEFLLAEESRLIKESSIKPVLFSIVGIKRHVLPPEEPDAVSVKLRRFGDGRDEDEDEEVDLRLGPTVRDHL